MENRHRLFCLLGHIKEPKTIVNRPTRHLWLPTNTKVQSNLRIVSPICKQAQLIKENRVVLVYTISKFAQYA